MTNKKIKDYHKNKMVYDVLIDNFKLLSIILLCLNRHFPKVFYQLNVQKWFEEYAEWCSMMNEYEEDDVYEYKMKSFCEKCGVDDLRTAEIVKKHCGKHSAANSNVLRENAKLALVHTAVDFGFGEKRLNRLVDALLNDDYPDWKEEIKAFGIDIDYELSGIDYRKLKPKKKKETSVIEQKEAREKLAEYSAYFDYVLSQERVEC